MWRESVAIPFLDPTFYSEKEVREESRNNLELFGGDSDFRYLKFVL